MIKAIVIDNRMHELYPEFYPKSGTIGIVRKLNTNCAIVDWPKGSTSMSGTWCVPKFMIRII